MRFCCNVSTAWFADAAELRQEISDYFGSAGTNIELVCTENNSDAGAPGKQSTSLVNGLYYADSLGQLMKTEFNAFVWWDLRNGTDTNGCFDPELYGWRSYGDLGIINGLNNVDPVFYAAKMMSAFIDAGDQVLAASSDYPLLSAYAARGKSGELRLLVLHKDPSTNFTAEISLAGYLPSPAGQTLCYGILQDDAARTNATASAQDVSTNVVAGLGTNFTYTFAPLSLTLISFPPAAPSLTLLPPVPPTSQVTLELRGQPGVRYVIQSSSDLLAGPWSSISTNTLASTTLDLAYPSGQATRYWRAVWQP